MLCYASCLLSHSTMLSSLASINQLASELPFNSFFNKDCNSPLPISWDDEFLEYLSLNCLGLFLKILHHYCLGCSFLVFYWMRLQEEQLPILQSLFSY